MLATLIVALALAAPADVTFDQILVLPPQGGGMRAPFRADPVLEQIATGQFHNPADGDHIGKRAWEKLTPNQDGTFAHQSLGGGYAFATFEAAADSVMILEASGHVMVYVNGEPRTGDPYENGVLHLPVLVHKGENTLLFQAGRGRLRASLKPAPSPVFISAADPTMPDLLEGAATYGTTGDRVLGAVVLVNATEAWQRGLTVLAYGPGAKEPVRSPVPPIPPLSIRKVPVSLAAQPELKTGEATFEFAVVGGGGGGARVPFKVRVRNDHQTRKVTFLSEIDHSVQYFGYNPVVPGEKVDEGIRPALFLSLHGASVEAAHQAECYTMKDWGALAAPTNRREYGFDWEDWGRLDALEVLGLATAMVKPDPSRIYLTGHSMGGHGTWLIGATYPGKFAAIGPSAGWTTFWSYGGAEHFDKDPTAIELMFRKAMNVGDTIGLSRNLINDGVYVLHGDVDDNVPVTQARTMRKLLAEFHPDFAYHEQPGANHWWGNECMDWPPLFSFLRAHRTPANEEVTHLQYTTANPAVSSTCHWATIQQQLVQADFSTINLEANLSHATITGETTNVAALSLDVSILAHEKPITIELDKVKIENIPHPKNGKIYLSHTDAWTLADAPPLPGQKGPARAGPFKHAFNRQAVLVYGTRGSAAENAWAFGKARYDAETIYYRGNGGFDMVPDTEFMAEDFRDRSVILYGNADTNSAWATLLQGSPVEVREGVCRVGGHEYKGDQFAALFTRPRADSPDALIGAIACTGMPGAHAAERLPYMSSGVAYPDWTVFSTDVLSEGMKGVQAAGYFGNDWGLSDSAYAGVP